MARRGTAGKGGNEGWQRRDLAPPRAAACSASELPEGVGLNSGKPHRCHPVVSAAPTQAECIWQLQQLRGGCVELKRKIE